MPTPSEKKQIRLGDDKELHSKGTPKEGFQAPWTENVLDNLTLGQRAYLVK